MGNSNRKDINVVDWADPGCSYADVQREVGNRITVDDWLKKKNLTLTNCGAIVFTNATLGVAHMLEEALMCLADTAGYSTFVFRRSQLDEAARQLCGEGGSLQRLQDGCNRAAATTRLADHPAVATEWDFLARKPRLNKKKMSRWNTVMDGAFHRYEPTAALQYEVRPREKKFETDRVYPWDFLETVFLYAGGAV